MNTISKIIYTVIVCRFLMCIRARLMSKSPIGAPKFLLIQQYPGTRVAVLYGYADSVKPLHRLMHDMLAHGFKPTDNGSMALVCPLGNGMFKYFNSEGVAGPYRLNSTTHGRWFDISRKHGMKAETIDELCSA